MFQILYYFAGTFCGVQTFYLWIVMLYSMDRGLLKHQAQFTAYTLVSQKSRLDISKVRKSFNDKYLFFACKFSTLKDFGKNCCCYCDGDGEK